MRTLTLFLLLVAGTSACKDEPQKEAPKPAKDLVIPVAAEKYLVVERTSEAEQPFATYRTYEIAPADTGFKVRDTFDGFHIEAGGRQWSLRLEEQQVEDSRDCTCESLATEGCTSSTTMRVPVLAQQGKEQTWKPPIYTTATRGLASWETSSARAWVRGDVLFTSVCLDVMKCGETPRPVCQSTAWSLAGETPKVLELESLSSGAPKDLIDQHLAKAEPRSKAHQALTQAKEAGSEPVLVEVRPTFDGQLQRRFVVPADIRATGDWTAYTQSLIDTVPAAKHLERFAALPRTVSIFSNAEARELVGWSASSKSK